MAQKKITDEQLQEELNAGMKNIDIARKYGISDRVIRIRKAKLAKKGVGHGRDVSHLVPDGYKIKGTRPWWTSSATLSCNGLRPTLMPNVRLN